MAVIANVAQELKSNCIKFDIYNPIKKELIMANTKRNSHAKKATATRGGTHQQHVEAGRKGGLAHHESRGRHASSTSTTGRESSITSGSTDKKSMW